MPGNLSFIRHRLQLHLKGQNTRASDVIVHWIETDGGTPDDVTRAMVGGVQTPASGVMRAFGYEEPARTVLRQFAEIKAGDLILDVDPDGVVELAPPQSGTVRLDDIARQGVRFEWGGRLYSQAQIGEELAEAWDVIVGNQKLFRTLLLRRAT